MSIFICFNKINYKCANNFIIGRGHPFTSDDSTFSRDHAQIIKNSKGIFLKRRHKELKLKIDGKEIKDSKFHLISPGMGFFLGESYFKILENKPTDFQNLEHISFKSSQFFSQENVGNITLIFAFFHWIYKQLQAPLQNVTSYLEGFAIFAGFAILLKIYFKFLRTISNENKLLGKEVIITKKGMTIFFVNGKNFSFNFSDVQSWTHKGLITTINCYDKTLAVQSSSTKIFSTPTKNDVGELPYYLMKNIPGKEEKSEIYTLIFLRILTIFPLFYFGVFLEHSESNPKVIFKLITVIASYVMLLYLLKEDRIRKIWYFYDISNKNYKMKQNYLLALVSIGYFICLGDAFSNYKSIPELKTISSCAHGSEADCKNLNYKLILRSGLFYKNNIQTHAKIRCDQGHKEACSVLLPNMKMDTKLTKRELASEAKN